MSDLSVTITRYVEEPVVDGDILGTHEEVEYEIEIEGSFYAGCRGSRDSMGVPEEPDDPEEVEIIEATLDGHKIELTDKEVNTAEEALYQAVIDGALDEY